MKVGILGAGQLAQLLAQSAYSLGLQTLCFADKTDAEAPAARLSPIYRGDLNDETALKEFAQQCDVITLENENISPEILGFLAQYKPVLPDKKAIAVLQDRLTEKSLLQTLGIPCAPFVAVNSLVDLDKAIVKLGCPAILKTRRFGYDGKGQARLQAGQTSASAWQAIGKAPAILEAWVPFEQEVSLIAARHVTGATVFYPLIKNTHQHGILRYSESPYIAPDLQALAEQYMQVLLDALAYTGVLVIEFFVTGRALLANEVAPRVHNSGHLTIEGFNASQFENHLRSILDLPLIKPILRIPTKMINIIGTMPLLTPEDYKNAHLYDYGKLPRAGRKLGHLTQYADNEAKK